MDRRALMAMMALAANVPLNNAAPAHTSGKTWIEEGIGQLAPGVQSSGYVCRGGSSRACNRTWPS